MRKQVLIFILLSAWSYIVVAQNDPATAKGNRCCSSKGDFGYFLSTDIN